MEKEYKGVYINSRMMELVTMLIVLSMRGIENERLHGCRVYLLIIRYLINLYLVSFSIKIVIKITYTDRPRVTIQNKSACL